MPQLHTHLRPPAHACAHKCIIRVAEEKVSRRQLLLSWAFRVVRVMSDGQGRKGGTEKSRGAEAWGAGLMRGGSCVEEVRKATNIDKHPLYIRCQFVGPTGYI